MQHNIGHKKLIFFSRKLQNEGGGGRIFTVNPLIGRVTNPATQTQSILLI